MITTTAPSRGRARRPAPGASAARASRGGFTLVEVMVTTVVGSIVLAGLTASFIFVIKSTASLGNYSDMNRESRFGLEVLGRDVRMATEVANVGALGVDLRVETMAGAQWVVYAYDSEEKMLTRTGAGGQPRKILRDVENLQFLYFTLRGDPTTNPNEIKKIQLDALMLRNVITIENTNQVISARFMMRNRQVAN